MFEFLPFCCDAGRYLSIGQLCAESGHCYDGTRPMGVHLWFSIPYHLGLPPAPTLITLHIILLVISIGLSLVVAKRIWSLRNGGNNARPPSRWQQATFLVISAAIHSFYIYPVMQVPLSDAPASLLVLIAIWLFLAGPSGGKKQFFLMAIAALCLGLAAWLRSFFVFPMLFTIACVLIVFFFSKNKLWAAPVILLALFPYLIQTLIVLPERVTQKSFNVSLPSGLVREHLNNQYIGYDTLVDEQGGAFGWFWSSSCPEHQSFADAIGSADFYSVYCLVKGRMNFYLGSYNAQTYIPTNTNAIKPRINLLQKFDLDKNTWISSNTDWEKRVSQRKFLGTKTYNALRSAPFFHHLQVLDRQKPGQLTYTIDLPASKNPYVFSLWLSNEYDPSPEKVWLSVIDTETRLAIEKRYTLARYQVEKKQLYFVIEKTGRYEITIELRAATNHSQDAHSPRADVWANPELYLAEPTIEGAKQSLVRFWSPWLLLINLVVLFSVIIVYINNKNFLNHMQQTGLILLLLMSIQAVISLPEQRFAISSLTAIWVLFASFILSIKKPNAKKQATNE